MASPLPSTFGTPWAAALAAPALSDSVLLGLDWLLDGEELASVYALDPLRISPPLPEAPWRCLDASHDASCQRCGRNERAACCAKAGADTRLRSCTPAPADADAARYRLTTAEGQLTEKRLRSLLARCPEWNDASERQRLIAALEAEEAASGEASGAVEVLRSHSCANMRKRAMLCLAHRWRYRSDCWLARGAGAALEVGRSRKRRAPDAGRGDGDGAQLLLALAGPSQQEARQHQQLTLSLQSRTYVALDAAKGHVLELLAPHIAVAARAWLAPHSAAQYGRVRGEGMTWLRVRTVEGAVEATAWMCSVCTLRLDALRAWRETLSPEELRAPAYLSHAAFCTPDSELEALRFATSQARASTYAAADALRAQSGGTLRAQDAAWVLDFDIGHDNAMAMIAAAHAFVASQRMHTLHAYLEAAEAVLGGVCRYTRQTVQSLEKRLVWISEAAASQGPAAGVRAEAQARVPPLVERMRLTRDCEEGIALLRLATVPPPKGAPPERFALCASR